MTKLKFSRQVLVDHALDIAKEEGFDAISVRRVAAQAGCSTGPIYTAFANVEDLIQETKNRVLDLLLEHVEEEYTPDSFLNVGVGTLVFTHKHPRLYKELYIDSFDAVHERRIRQRTVDRMKEAGLTNYLSEENIDILMSKMWLFTHGIASKICSGAVTVEGTADFIEMLRETGGEIITAMVVKSGRYTGTLEELIEGGEENESRHFRWNIWNNR